MDETHSTQNLDQPQESNKKIWIILSILGAVLLLLILGGIFLLEEDSTFFSIFSNSASSSKESVIQSEESAEESETTDQDNSGGEIFDTSTIDDATDTINLENTTDTTNDNVDSSTTAENPNDSTDIDTTTEDPPINDTNDTVEDPPVDDPNEPTYQTFTIEFIISGYSPSSITINSGDSVTFLNTISTETWPATNQHPSHTIYPGSDIDHCGTSEELSTFDACGGLGQGESYTFTFNEVGNWNYHDHLWVGNSGTIIVQ